MTGPYKDTISSGKAYYDNQYRNDPGVIKGYAKIREIGASKVDTIETSQQRLERDLQGQLYNHGTILLMAEVGRYTILALVLPPYYLFFEGPKWVLIHLQPYMQLTLEKMGEFLLMIVTFSFDLWAGLGKKLQFFKRPKNYLKNKIELAQQFAHQWKEKITLKLAQILKPVIRWGEKLQNLLKTYREKKQEAVLRFKTFPLWLKKTFSQKSTHLKAIIMEKCRSFAKKLTSQISKIINPVASLVSGMLLKATTPIVQVAKTSAKVIQYAILAIVPPLQLWVQENLANPIKQAYKAVIAPLEIVKNKIKEGVDFIRNEMVLKAHAVTKQAQNLALAAIVPLQRMAKEGSLSLVKKMQEVMNRIKGIKPPIKRMFKLLFDQGKKHGKNAFAKLQKAAIFAFKKGKVCLNLALKQIRKIPSLFARVWKHLRKGLVHIAKRIIWAARLLLAWTKVLLRYSVSNLWN